MSTKVSLCCTPVSDISGPTRWIQPHRWFLGPFKTFMVLNRYPLLVRVGRLLQHCQLLFHKDNYVRCVLPTWDGMPLRKLGGGNRLPTWDGMPLRKFWQRHSKGATRRRSSRVDVLFLGESTYERRPILMSRLPSQYLAYPHRAPVSSWFHTSMSDSLCQVSVIIGSAVVSMSQCLLTCVHAQSMSAMSYVRSAESCRIFGVTCRMRRALTEIHEMKVVRCW